MHEWTIMGTGFVYLWASFWILLLFYKFFFKGGYKKRNYQVLMAFVFWYFWGTNVFYLLWAIILIPTVIYLYIKFLFLCYIPEEERENG